MTLGQGETRIFITERGNGRFVCDLSPYVASATYNFARNQIGTASIDLAFGESPTGERCADEFAQVEPWAHELQIVRDGQPSFCGPISRRPMVTGQTGTLDANSMLAWLDVRFARNDRDYTAGVDGSTFVSVMLQDALLIDDPNWYQYIVVKPGIPSISRNVVSVEDNLVWTDVLLPQMGGTFDCTSVGRAAWFWPAKAALGYIPHSLTIEDFGGEWEMDLDGTKFATRMAVHGDSETAVRGVAGVISPRYGLVERRFEDTSIMANFQAAATAQLNLTERPPLVITGDSGLGTLSCDANVEFRHLIPGSFARVSLISGREQVDRFLRLETVEVQLNTDQKNLPESVACTWSDVARVG